MAPIEVAITPDGTTVYVTNAVSHTVSAIDTGTNLVTSIPVGAGPSGVWSGNTPFGMRAFLTNSESDTSSVIDADPNSPTFNKVVDTIIKKVGDSPSDAAFTANGRKGYVPNNNDNTVSVIDTSTKWIGIL
ncbi:YncE family protein [Neobacillus drentensis]|uniref:YncE family protein n=1 Tax=Neobacillus drentensis TaxID=220684 RepID=UPI0030033210